MGRECVITFATITSVDITAHADTVTFSMTTIDPAQVRAREMFTRAQSKWGAEYIDLYSHG